jgi:hypothetical protein
MFITLPHRYWHVCLILRGNHGDRRSQVVYLLSDGVSLIGACMGCVHSPDFDTKNGLKLKEDNDPKWSHFPA